MRTGSATLALIVLGLPFASFLLLALVRPLRRSAGAAAGVSITAIAGALVAAILDFRSAVPREPTQSPSTTWTWLPGDGGPMATVGVMVDDLSLTMLCWSRSCRCWSRSTRWAYLHDEPRPSLGPLLRVSLAVRLLDARAGAGAELSSDVHLLGAGRPLLLPPDRLLVRPAVGRARRGEGVLDHQAGRPRLRGRHRHAVVGHRDLRLLDAVRDGARRARCRSSSWPASCS